MRKRVQIAEHQLRALNMYGNTIFTNKLSDEEIVELFSEIGVTVKVREFKAVHSTYGKKGKETHKVVELVKGCKASEYLNVN